MIFLSASTKEFISQHRTENVRILALQAAKHLDVDIPVAMAQISGWQAASVKIPTWAKIEEIYYPPHLSMEQCSSESTARYKAQIVKGESLVDLTGGFGVDCAFLASNFHSVTYVEHQKELCNIASHNFPLIGLSHIKVINADATTFLHTMQPVDCIYIDPARRNNRGGKTIAIADCEPNVAALEKILLEKAAKVMVKLSPMLDLSSALKELPHTQEVHIIAVDNECKELLVVLSKMLSTEVPIHCVHLSDSMKKEQTFTFTREQEQSCKCQYADTLATYLYEPNTALLKGGGYKSLAKVYGLAKLHPNTHLYTSNTFIKDFPGRIFRVLEYGGFKKNELKETLRDLKKANISIRNFPATVAELRKRFKLSEGGDTYLFATTIGHNNRLLIRCEKASVM